MQKRYTALLALVAILLIAIVAGGCQSGNTGSTQSSGQSGAMTPAELLTKVSQSTANVAAISGSVSWNNDVFGISSLSGGLQGNGSVSALLSKGSGRLWIKQGKVRLEIQGSNGDTIINGDSSRVWVYSSQDSTATEYVFPAQSQGESTTTSVAGTTTTDLVTSISNLVSQLAPDATVTVAPQQTKVAGRNCYALSLVPKATNTVFGSLRVFVDAEKSIPLQIDVYAKGNTAPVLTAGFTSVSYSDFNSNLFNFTPPANAKVQHQNIAANEPSSSTTTMAAGAQGSTTTTGAKEQQPLTIAQATAQAGFAPLTAHVTDATLAFAGADVLPVRNIPLTFNPLAMLGSTTTQAATAAKMALVGPTVVQRYGQGFGTILLVEAKAPAQFITQLETQLAALSPLVGKTTTSGTTAYWLNSSLGSVAIWSKSGHLFAAAGSVSQADLARFIASVH